MAERTAKQIFEDSLKSGHVLENETIDYLKQFYKVRSTQGDGKNSNGDIYLTPLPDIIGPFPDEKDEFLVECKTDCSAYKPNGEHNTGNTGHEICKRRPNESIERQGGLSITKAKYYICGYAGRPEVYFISVEKLKKMVEEKKYHTIKSHTGQFEDATLALFYVDWFNEQCTKLYDNPNYYKARGEMKDGSFVDKLLKRNGFNN